MDIEIDGVGLSLEGRDVVRDVSLVARSGRVTGLVGANGSGKSTLLRCVTRVRRPDAGRVRVGGDDVWRDLTARESACRTAVLAQERDGTVGATVAQLVTTGRTPHLRGWGRLARRDRDAIEDALARARVAHLAGRRVATLSGGERQRVLLARALAQQPRVLVLDEPTNHLDVRAQLELLDLVTGLGLTVLVALHDLGHAAHCCDEVAVLRDGRLLTSAPPERALAPEQVRAAFDVDAELLRAPRSGRPVIACSLPS